MTGGGLAHLAGLEFLEVEIDTFCNRTCSWCGNGHSDRGRSHRAMRADVWQALIADLERHNYGGRFAFHNYNEPLLSEGLFERLGELVRRVPACRPHIYTNGDPLDAALLARLRDAGVAQVNVTLYPAESKAFDAPDPARIDRFLERIGQAGRGVDDDRERKLVRTLRVGALRLVVRVPRIDSYVDRAGSVGLVALQRKSGARTDPCSLPQTAAAVDVDGRLKLCCHAYAPSTPGQASLFFAPINEVPLSRQWAESAFTRARDQLARADFSGLPACARCPHKQSEGAKVAEARARKRAAASTASPEVSVVMTVHNGARFLDEAIHSVLAENEVALELVIVDDASDDASREVLDALDDPRVIVVPRRDRSGPYAAANAGIVRARARFIARVDADDRVLPGRLRAQLERLRQGAALVGGGARLIDDDGREIGTWPAAKGDDAIARVQNGELPFAHSSFCFDRVACAALGVAYDGSLFVGGDYAFVVDAVNAGAVIDAVDAVVVDYRRHAAGLSVVAAQERSAVRIAARARLRSSVGVTLARREPS